MHKKSVWIPLCLKWRQAIRSWRIRIGYLYGFWLGISMEIRYVIFSSGLQTGLAEGYLLLTNDLFQTALFLIGFFIIIADAPFVDPETYYILIRSGGPSWRISMIGYIAAQLVLYQGLVLAGGMLPVLWNGNFTTDWSETMHLMAGPASGIAMLEYGLPVPDRWMLSVWSAPEALLHSFLLSGLYCFLLGIVVFTGNLNVRLPLGNLAAIGIHFIGMLVMSDFVPLYWPSMVAHGMLKYHIPGRGMLSLGTSYVLFAVCIAGVLTVLKWISRRTDYNTAVSQKVW